MFSQLFLPSLFISTNGTRETLFGLHLSKGHSDFLGYGGDKNKVKISTSKVQYLKVKWVEVFFTHRFHLNLGLETLRLH